MFAHTFPIGKLVDENPKCNTFATDWEWERDKYKHYEMYIEMEREETSMWDINSHRYRNKERYLEGKRN